jgi:hypothetical protein
MVVASIMIQQIQILIKYINQLAIVFDTIPIKTLLVYVYYAKRIILRTFMALNVYIKASLTVIFILLRMLDFVFNVL